MFTENTSNLKMTNLCGKNLLSVTTKYKQKWSDLNGKKNPSFKTKVQYKHNRMSELSGYRNGWRLCKHNLWKYWPRNCSLFIWITNNVTISPDTGLLGVLELRTGFSATCEQLLELIKELLLLTLTAVGFTGWNVTELSSFLVSVLLYQLLS